jgi:hypothetical protein
MSLALDDITPLRSNIPQLMSSQPIEIDITSETIGTGGTRLCFPFPGDPNKCIKVYRPKSMLGNKKLRRLIRIWCATHIPIFNTSWHEYRFWEIHLKDGPTQFCTYFPKFYKLTPTSLGPGLIVECIRDANGCISKSLRDWYPKASTSDRKLAVEQIEFLTDIIIQRKLPCYDWGPQNFLVQYNGNDFQLKLIDFEGTLGNNEFIPISTIFPPLRRLKLKRRIQRGLLSWLDQSET